MTFFFDNNLSPKMVRALAALEKPARHLRDDFPADTPDEVWIKHCASAGWVAVTKDTNIQSKPHLRKELLAVGTTILFIPRFMNSMSPEEQTVFFLQAWTKMEAAASAARPGRRLYLFQRNGKLNPF